MKKTHKYIISPAIYLLVFLAAAIPYLLVGYIVDGVFALLCEELPRVFVSHSFVSAPAEYAAQVRTLTAVKLSLTYLAVAYVSLLADNKRGEYVISLTDGRYTIPRGMLLYYPAFFTVDVISAAIPPVLLTLPAVLLPERVMNYGIGFVLRPVIDATEAFGAVGGALVLAIISIAARLVTVPAALKRWRVSWLSGEL